MFGIRIEKLDLTSPEGRISWKTVSNTHTIGPLKEMRPGYRYTLVHNWIEKYWYAS